MLRKTRERPAFVSLVCRGHKALEHISTERASARTQEKGQTAALCSRALLQPFCSWQECDEAPFVAVPARGLLGSRCKFVDRDGARALRAILRCLTYFLVFVLPSRGSRLVYRRFARPWFHISNKRDKRQLGAHWKFPRDVCSAAAKRERVVGNVATTPDASPVPWTLYRERCIAS